MNEPRTETVMEGKKKEKREIKKKGGQMKEKKLKKNL